MYHSFIINKNYYLSIIAVKCTYKFIQTILERVILNSAKKCMKVENQLGENHKNLYKEQENDEDSTKFS